MCFAARSEVPYRSTIGVTGAPMLAMKSIEAASMIGIMALARSSKRWRRLGADGTLAMPSAVLKKASSRRFSDGVEIALARAEQTDVTLHTIGVCNAMAQPDLGKVAVEVGVAKRTADQCQARMRREAVGVRSHDIEAPHVPSPTK